MGQIGIYGYMNIECECNEQGYWRKPVRSDALATFSLSCRWCPWRVPRGTRIVAVSTLERNRSPEWWRNSRLALRLAHMSPSNYFSLLEGFQPYIRSAATTSYSTSFPHIHHFIPVFHVTPPPWPSRHISWLSRTECREAWWDSFSVERCFLVVSKMTSWFCWSSLRIC